MNKPNVMNGEEKYEEYYSDVVRRNCVQYDYRHTDGELFSCVKPTLEMCREKRDQWIARKSA